MKKGIIAIIIIAVVVVGALVGVKMMKKQPSSEQAVQAEKATSGKVTSAKETPLAKKTRRSTVKGQYQVDNMIPANTILYASIRDMKNTWGVIESSNFWTQLTSLKVWAEADMDANIALLKDQVKANLGIDLTEDSIMGVLGQDVSIAVVSGGGTPLNPNVLILADMDQSSGAPKDFAALLDKFEENLTVESKDYNGVQISSVQNPAVPGPQFNYAFLGNVFVLGIGIDDSVVKTAIDLGMGKDKKNLASTDNFKKSVEKLSVRGELKGMIFINIEQIVEILKSFPIPAGTEGAVVTEGIEKTLGIISSIVAAVSVDDGVFVKLYFMKNQNAENKELLDAWDIKPRDSKSLSLIPEGTLLLSVSNSLNISNIWSVWKTNLEAQNPDQADVIFSGLKSFEDEVGLSVENDILPVLGEEITFVVSDITLGGLFPFPQLALVIEVTNEGKAADVMGKLIDYVIKTATPGVSEEGEGGAGLVSRETEAYDGKEITYLDVKLPYQTLNPSYVINKGFLVIASSKTGLQTIIDTASGKAKSIQKDTMYKKVTKSFAGKINQLGYINLNKALDIAIEITNWAANLQAAGTPEAENTKMILQQNVVPFLNCLKALHGVGIEAVNHDDGVSETIVINIEDTE